MMTVRHALAGLGIILLSNAAVAQTVTEPPRFDGDRSTASSAQAIVPSDGQRTTGAQSVPSLNALIGAAAREAAREEGRHFTQDRRTQSLQSNEE